MITAHHFSTFPFLQRLMMICIFLFSFVYGQTKVDSLLSLIKMDKEDTSKVNDLNLLAWELMYSNPDTSIIMGMQALELAAKILKSVTADKDEGLKLKAKKGIAQSCNGLGVFFWLKGAYPVSIEYHLKAYQIRKNIGSKLGMSTSLNNLGLVYKSQGNFIASLECYQQSLQLCTELGEFKLIATDLANIGSIYAELGENDKALDFFQKSILVGKKINDKVVMANTFSSIGNLYYYTNNYVFARKYYSDGLKIAEEIGNYHLVANILCNLGSIEASGENFDAAMKYFDRGLEIAWDLGDFGIIATITGNIGIIYSDQGNFREAERYLLESLEISKEIGSLLDVSNLSQSLSELYAKSGDFKLAYEYHVHYVTTNDSIFNDQKSKEIGRLEAQYELEMQTREQKLSEQEKLRFQIRQRTRKNLLQYSGILILLVLITLVVIIFGYIKVSARMASAITFFAFLLLFEFLLVLLDPYIDDWCNGEPAYKLFFIAIIAALIFPIHGFFERFLKKKMIK